MKSQEDPTNGVAGWPKSHFGKSGHFGSVSAEKVLSAEPLFLLLASALPELLTAELLAAELLRAECPVRHH